MAGVDTISRVWILPGPLVPLLLLPLSLHHHRPHPLLAAEQGCPRVRCKRRGRRRRPRRPASGMSSAGFGRGQVEEDERATCVEVLLLLRRVVGGMVVAVLLVLMTPPALLVAASSSFLPPRTLRR